MTQSVLIHCQPAIEDSIQKTSLCWEYMEDQDVPEIDVIVENVDYLDGNHPSKNGIWEDPDVQLCEHYGIDYDLVNCIESVS